MNSTETPSDYFMYCIGVADWVYEEEVLSDTRAIWFSPNGDKVRRVAKMSTNLKCRLVFSG